MTFYREESAKMYGQFGKLKFPEALNARQVIALETCSTLNS